MVIGVVTVYRTCVKYEKPTLLLKCNFTYCYRKLFSSNFILLLTNKSRAIIFPRKFCVPFFLTIGGGGAHFLAQDLEPFQ